MTPSGQTSAQSPHRIQRGPSMLMLWLHWRQRVPSEMAPRVSYPTSTRLVKSRRSSGGAIGISRRSAAQTRGLDDRRGPGHEVADREDPVHVRAERVGVNHDVAAVELEREG